MKMGNSFKLAMTLLFAVIFSVPAYADGAGDAQFSAGLNLGYYSGFSIQGFGKVSHFAQGFPLEARLGIGYSRVEPGNALDARRIFINDATNGYPEKGGTVWDFRFDFLYPTHILSLDRGFFFVGPRYSRFTGNFKFVGGNEDFNISSHQWGLGLGLESYYLISSDVDMVISTGFDYFFSNRLTGHDTSYSPDGEDINARNDYTYDDADKAIAQPKLEPRFMVGFNYRF